MNQRVKKNEFSEQTQPKSKFKWPPYRTLPCTVALQGLVVGSHKHTPTDLEKKLIPWECLIIRAPIKLVTVYESDSKPFLINGRLLQLKLASEREALIAMRVKDRYLHRKWQNGELSLNHEFEISNKTRKIAYIKTLFFVIPWLVIQALFFVPKIQSIMLWTGHIRILMLLTIGGMLFCSFALVGVVIYMLCIASRSNVKSISLNTEGIEVAFLDGRNLLKSWYEITNIQQCRFSFEVKCISGEKFEIPASGSIRPIIKMIQQEIYPECEVEEKRKLKNTMNRSYLWCFLGGIICAGLTAYLQSLGLLATSGPFPVIYTFLGIGIALPALMMFSNWHETRSKQKTSKRRRREKKTESHAAP